MIEVLQVSREFRTLQKNIGWNGIFQSFFNPRYHTFHALQDITFTLEAGSFTGLIGANGAGKTTLLKILTGLIPPTAGTVKVMGEVPFERSIHYRKSIALVMGQKAQLWWDLPALDAFDLLCAIYQIPRKVFQSRLDELTDLLDVGRLLKTQIRKLSLGERMKMELIGAILHWPSIIFLDEPTIGLDSMMAKRLREFLRSFHEKQKTTVILTSHNMDDIESLCSEIMILKKGTLMFKGVPKVLMHEHEKQVHMRFDTPVTEQALIEELKDFESQYGPYKLTMGPQDGASFYFSLQQKNIPPLLSVILQKYSMSDVSIENVNLETIIHRIYTDNHKAMV